MHVVNITWFTDSMRESRPVAVETRHLIQVGAFLGVGHKTGGPRCQILAALIRGSWKTWTHLQEIWIHGAAPSLASDCVSILASEEAHQDRGGLGGGLQVSRQQ